MSQTKVINLAERRPQKSLLGEVVREYGEGDPVLEQMLRQEIGDLLERYPPPATWALDVPGLTGVDSAEYDQLIQSVKGQVDAVLQEHCVRWHRMLQDLMGLTVIRCKQMRAVTAARGTTH